MKNKPSFFKKL